MDETADTTPLIEEPPKKSKLNTILFLVAIGGVIFCCSLYEPYVKAHAPVFRDLKPWLVMITGVMFWSLALGTLLAIIPFRNKTYGWRWKRLVLIVANLLTGFYVLTFILIAL